MYYGATDGATIADHDVRGPRRPFEQRAADGTPVRAIVGDDPVEFVETFVRNYSGARGSTRSAPA